MALQMSLESQIEKDKEWNACYVRIHRIDIYASPATSDKVCRVMIQFYANKATRAECMSPIKEDVFTFNYDLESEDNLFTQAYTYLKTIDQFSEAVDV